jgi:protein-L-isoaspartate(D-aspartate) O-methyltransferase
MLKKSASGVLASFRPSTYPRGYVSGPYSLRPCCTNFLSILRDRALLPQTYGPLECLRAGSAFLQPVRLKDLVLHCVGLSIFTSTLLLFSVSGCIGDTHDPTRQAERDRMVNEQIVSRGIKDQAVLAAMRRIPRHMFVPAFYSAFAYYDNPLPIGHGQTISQPFVVALMSEALALQGAKKVLEIGTGSGYQAAILAEIVPNVFTIEIVEPLATEAAQTLAELGYRNIRTRVGDGYQGWPEEAPFDAIIVTASSEQVPQPLLDQLAVGGRLVLPVGKAFQELQELVLYRRTTKGYERSRLALVRFVPLIRKDQSSPPDKR